VSAEQVELLLVSGANRAGAYNWFYQLNAVPDNEFEATPGRAGSELDRKSQDSGLGLQSVKPLL
jgi:hypothetical protein